MAKMNPAVLVEGTRSDAARQTLTLALMRAAELLKVSQAELATILGISPASVSRMAAGRYLLNPDGKEWQLAALCVRLFRSLDSLTGGHDELSRQWLRSENFGLNGTPAAMLADVGELVRVVQYLDSSRAAV